jgi:hypothetical protein
MAGVKITALSPLATIADDDVIAVVDISEGNDGTTKKFTFGNFVSQITNVSNSTTSQQSNTVAITNVTNSSTQYIHFGDTTTGYGGTQINGELFFNPATGVFSAPFFSGDGSLLTNVIAETVDSDWLLGKLDAYAKWNEYTDGVWKVLRADYNLYIDATAGGDGTKTYIQGGDQQDLDIVAAGGNAFTSALLGLNQTGMHTRHGHIKIDDNGIAYQSETGTSHNFVGDINADNSVIAKNYVETVQASTSNTFTISPSSGSLISHTVSGNVTYTYNNNWAQGASVTIHIQTDSAWDITWPATKWAGGTEPTISSTTGAHLVNIWKMGVDSDFYGAYVGEAS